MNNSVCEAKFEWTRWANRYYIMQKNKDNWTKKWKVRLPKRFN
jgi:hypothetical protein